MLATDYAKPSDQGAPDPVLAFRRSSLHSALGNWSLVCRHIFLCELKTKDGVTKAANIACALQERHVGDAKVVRAPGDGYRIESHCESLVAGGLPATEDQGADRVFL